MTCVLLKEVDHAVDFILGTNMVSKEDTEKPSAKASTVFSFVAIIVCAFVAVRVEVVNHSLELTNSRVDNIDQRLLTLQHFDGRIKKGKMEVSKSAGW